MNAVGLEETKWPPVEADSFVTEVETSGVKCVLVGGLVMWFTYVESELRTSEDVSCLAVRWLFTVLDPRWLVKVTAGLVME